MMLSDIEIRFFAERVALLDDEDAYRKLFEHFYERLKRFAMGIVKSPDLAEDIIADTFFSFWASRSKITDIENINSYLYAVTKNISIKYMGSRGSITQFSIQDIDVRYPTVEKTPEEVLLSKELLGCVEAAIDALPPQCRLIYKLVRYERLRYKEIASILNISVKTIDAQMAIAARKITLAIRFKIPSGK